MARRTRRLPRLVVLLVALVSVGTMLALPAAQLTAAATDQLPDLGMARLADFRIEVTSSGRKLLRFSSTMTNRGAGPFTLRAQRSSTSSAWAVRQVIRNSAGGSRSVATGATMKYGGDGHGHWHINRMVDVDLWNSSRRIAGAKIGFCFFDTTAIALGLPGAPSSPVYRESGCGGQSALTSLMGISVGWGDKYRWSLPYQWIDITGLANGDYRVRAWADARNLFAESSNTNNCTYTRVRISGTSVTILGAGDVCSNDYSTHPEADAIRWVMSTGLMPACGADLFCPGNRLQRAHVARYLAAALRLPATTTDAFDDDDGNPDEAAINRAAAAGLLVPCGERRICPTSWATRAWSATALARGFGLPAATVDPFIDDEAEPDEESINRVAQADLMRACASAPNHFCPGASLNRAEMAGALYRQLGP